MSSQDDTSPKISRPPHHRRTNSLRGCHHNVPSSWNVPAINAPNIACTSPSECPAEPTETVPAGYETLALETAVMDLRSGFEQAALEARQAPPCPATPTYLALLDTGHTISLGYFHRGHGIYHDQTESIKMLQEVTRCVRSLHSLAGQDRKNQGTDLLGLLSVLEDTYRTDGISTDQIPSEWAVKVDELVNLTREVTLQMKALWGEPVMRDS